MHNIYKNFFDESLDYLCIAGFDGYFTDINSSMQKLLGISRDEISAKPFFDFIHPDDISKTEIEIKKLIKGSHTVNFECRFRNADGDYRFLRWSAYPDVELKNIFAIARDYTEKIKIDNILQISIEASPVAMVIVNSTGNIDLVNKETENLFGYSRKELIGKPIDILIPIPNRANHKGHMNNFMKNPEARKMGEGRDLTGLRKDGSEFSIEIALNPVDNFGEKLVIAAILDITQRKFIEEEVRAVEQMKSNFFANISHEFRTPLTLILGPIEQLIKKEQNPKMLEELRVMKRNANRMFELVNQLLELSKLDAGKLSLKVMKNDIVEFLRRITMSFSSLADIKKIALEFESDLNELDIYFDCDILEKIIVNLISNAFKFTGDDGAVRVKLEKVSDLTSGAAESNNDSISTEEEFLQIKVTDTGIGISSENLKNIFNRFYQVNIGNSENYVGTGIGLSLVYELVKLHHGKIKVESKPGEGSSFIVLLPVSGKWFTENEIVDKSKFASSKKLRENVTDIDHYIFEHYEEDELIENEKPIGLDEKVILVIEDNRDLLEYIERSLDQFYRIIKAENMDVGLQKAFSIIPDLVISDVMMPGKSGYDGCRILKSDEKTSHVPVILLTAKSEMADKIQGLELGADDYITKPFDTEELLTRVKNLIESREKLYEKFRKKIIIKPSGITVNSVDDNFLNKLMGVIENNMQNYLFSVDDLSREMCLSQSQLYRKLHALTNQSPVQFILSVRLQRAAELIEKNAGNISEIAFSTGFNSSSYFTKCFKKNYKLSPSQYKKTKR